MQLRPYQEEARQAVFSEWEKGNGKTLLVLPTGCGKTIVFAKITEDCVRNGNRVLILAHRGELLEQAADKIKKSTGLHCSVEKAEQSCLGSWHRVTVGSVQSLMREKRLSQFSSDYFDTIIVDEAHHCISDGYQRVLSYFEDANVLGVTATPDRGDMKNLGTYFDSLAYEYTLPKAIKEGYLSPIKALTIPLKLDLSGVAMQNGDFKVADLDNALEPYLHQIADEMLKNCADRKTVVFLPLIKTSQKFRDILNEKGFRAAEVNGESSNRAEILEAFDRGEYNVLCNSMLLTEGWDCPSVDCVIVLRPTKVRSLYSQMVGRGTRLCPGLLDGADKEKFYIFDFCGNFDFFRMGGGNATPNQLPLQGAIFNLKFQMAYKLQDLAYQTDELMEFRKSLVDDMVAKVRELNKENFAVRQHLRYVELYANAENYNQMPKTTSFLHMKIHFRLPMSLHR